MLDGQCMLTAVLRRCSSDRLSTALQDENSFDDERSDDVDRCSTSACMRGKRADTRNPRYQVGERRSCSPPRTAMVLRGSESSLMRCGRSITAESGYQLLMLDSPSTGAEDPVVFNAVRLRTALH